MLLHKYIKYIYGFDIINRLRIKVNKPSNFNDPFELLPMVIDLSPESIYNEVLSNKDYLEYFYNFAISQGKIKEPFDLFVKRINSPIGKTEFLKKVEGMANTLRNTCKTLRDKTSQIALMTCFCEESKDEENAHEILMWSHYADAHKGLRITFDKDLLNIQGTSFIKINYELDRIELNPLYYFRYGNQYLNETYGRILNTKGSIWLYEKEYRWLVYPKQCHKGGEHLFFPINPKAIVEIVCGVESTLEQIESIKKLVQNNFSAGVKVKKAEIDDHKFKLNYIEC